MDELYVAALVLALAALLAVLIAGWLGRARVRVRNAHAHDGEREAAALLEAHGYTVVGRQVTIDYPVELDGELVEMTLRADYLVTREGYSFIAEVKTGIHAPRIDTAATRRQLLEYDVAFGVDGILLVDADAGRIHSVAFPMLTRRRALRSA